jgi:RHS repeat-associated protein
VRHRWTYTDNDRNEHLRIEDAAGTVVHTVFKRYMDINFGSELSPYISRELVDEIVGGDPATTADFGSSNSYAGAVRTSYTYHSGFNDASSGNWHKISSISSNDGSWATFYYCNEFRNRGAIFQVRKPHGDTLAWDSGPGTYANMEITTFSYDFVDNWGTQRLPTAIETKTDGKFTARSEFSYAYETITDSSATYEAGGADMPLIVVTRKDYVDNTQFLTTKTRAYREDADPQFKFFPGLPYSVERPDKTMTVMAYFRAAYSSTGPFGPNQVGGARVHVTLNGTTAATLQDGVTPLIATHAMANYEVPSQPLPANFRVAYAKSTESRILLDIDGLPRVIEQRAYLGSWQVTRQDWPGYVDAIWPGVTQRRTASSGAFWNVVENTWTAGRLEASVNETGVRQTFGYDTVGRMRSITREGASAAGATIVAQTVTQTYDAAGRVKTSSTTAAGETLITSTNYDTAGRVTSQSAPGVNPTGYAYDVAARKTTLTLPTTFTQIETRLRDGRVKSVAGTAVVGEYYDYAIEEDGKRRTTAYVRASGDVRQQTVWTDWLGRATQRQRPGFNSPTPFTEAMSYDPTTGQLTGVTRTGYAETRYAYNAMGEATRSGRKLGGSGLSEATADRISEADTSFENYDGAYWVTASSWVFHKNGVNEKKLVGLTRRRITGLSPTLRAETRSWDAEQNEAREVVTVETANKLVTTTTTRPGMAVAATEISLNGMAVKSVGHDGLEFKQTYDALGRVQSVIDPRTGTANQASALVYSVSYLHGTTFPLERRDASGGLISAFSYDGAGRVKVSKGAQIGVGTSSYTPTTRVSYNRLGQVEYQWGSGGYPVSYGYNDYGQRTHLRTYRDPAGTVNNYWDAETWPGGGVSPQTTQWDYDPATGLLTKKTDAGNKATDYTYNERGQTASRQWARAVPGNPAVRVTATYDYFPGTGEPRSITYNDGTPGVSYEATVGDSYTRLGQPLVVTDATGTRTFSYDANSPWRLNAESLASGFYANRKLATLYEPLSAGEATPAYPGHLVSAVPGRYAGYRLGTNVLNPQDATYDLQQTYGGSNTGRLAGLQTKWRTAAGLVSRQFTYGYETNSTLISSLSVVGNAFQVTRTYEPQRDLLAEITSKFGSAPDGVRTRYSYTYDALRQRAVAVQSGDAGGAFAELGTTHQRYNYNPRGELMSAWSYHGPESAGTAKPLSARLHDYAYDAMGNRKSSNASGVAALPDGKKIQDDYTANDLNQYAQRENNTLVMSGTAEPTAKVAVSGPSPTPDGGQVLAGRPEGGGHWGTNLVVDNGKGLGINGVIQSAPFVGDVTAYAVRAGAGAGGKDLFRKETRLAAFLAPAVQVFSYDADGNLTSDGMWNYTWDAENRLIRMETTTVAALAGRPDQVLEFKYDYRHRRVAKKVFSRPDPLTSYTLTSERRFVYDGWNVIAETDGAGAIKRSYAWGLDLSGSAQGAGGVGGLLQIRDNDQNKTLFPCYDGNGNITALLNADTGGVEASYEYSPFGELQRCAGAYATANPFRFSTKWQDDESGLIYYGVRYYAPREGRFLGRDPIAEEGGLNLYGFCGNDGVNHTDYLGYSWLSKQLKSIGNWITKNKQAIIMAVAIVASIYVGFQVSAWVQSSMTTSAIAAGNAATSAAIAAGAPGMAAMQAGSFAITNALAGSGVISGMVGGAAGGAVAGGIMTGSLKGALQGAASGAIMGGISGYYGKSFTLGRVASTAIGGGVSSEISGGRFRDGLFVAGGLSMLQWLNHKMRDYEWDHSPEDAKSKDGPGLDDDGKTVGGGRPRVVRDQNGNVISVTGDDAPFGGEQGKYRKRFILPRSVSTYGAGSIRDRIVESFSGPHDFLGHPWTYNSAGLQDVPGSLFGGPLSRTLGLRFANLVSNVMTAVDIPLAAPFAAAANVRYWGYNFGYGEPK